MQRKGLFNQVKMILTLSALTVACAFVAQWFTGQGRNVVHAAISTSAPDAGYHAEMRTEPATAKANAPVNLSFLVKNAQGATVRFLQFVHEKPLHLLIVSEDLSEFFHIHPEMQVDDSYGVQHVFPYGGGYRLYADYTPPGAATIVEQFELHVDGPTRPRVSLSADTDLTKTIDGLRVDLISDQPIRAGEDLALRFKVFDEH